jgi:hypothetical protein
MGLFYDTYAGNEKLSPLVREIGWTFDLFSWRVQGRTRGPILPHPYEDEKLPPTVAEVHWINSLLTHHIENKPIVEYALREPTKPIGVASYRVVSTLPVELRGQLPAPDQVSKLLEDL